jgi:hypothetical protein
MFPSSQTRDTYEPGRHVILVSMVFGDSRYHPRQVGARGLHLWWCLSSTESRFLGWKPKVRHSLVVPSTALLGILFWEFGLSLDWKPKKKLIGATTSFVHYSLFGASFLKNLFCSLGVIFGGGFCAASYCSLWWGFVFFSFWLCAS